MGDMSQQSLVDDLKALLNDAASKFTNDPGDFQRHLAAGAVRLSRYAPRVVSGEITLEAGKSRYVAPADMLLFRDHSWFAEERHLPQWDPRYPGRLPSVRQGFEAGDQALYFTPAPTAGQIAAGGATFEFNYSQAMTVDDAAANTTVPEKHRLALLYFAAEESMRELALKAASKPVKLGAPEGVGNMPKNSTPAALADSLHSAAMGLLQ